MKERRGWYGFDIDKTLFMYETGIRFPGLGPVITKMADRIRRYLKEGRDVQIVTARVCEPAFIASQTDTINEACMAEFGRTGHSEHRETRAG